MPETTVELLRRTRGGDREALEALLQQNLPRLRAFVRARMSPLLRAHESESDLVQSACAEVLTKLGDFEYRGEAPFRAWLFTAVLHKVRRRERDLRAHKRDARRLEAGREGRDSLAECYAQALSPSRAFMAEEGVRELEAAMDALPDHYREVLALSRFARLSRAEIAAHMGRSEDSVRNLLSRALAALAERLDGRRSAGQD